MRRPPDWQLPQGVDGGLWDYIHDAGIARSYDATLADSLLFQTDLPFAEKHCQTSGRLLDLGCGTGRASLYFAERGHQVVAVDLSTEMLKVLRRKADERNLSIDCLRVNLTNLRAFRDQSFDTVLCLFSTLGMIVGKEHRQRTCLEVARILKPGGRFILHVHNRWHNLYNPQGRRWLLRNFYHGDCVMPPHQGIGQLKLHLFTKGEIKRLLKQCGFHIRVIQGLSLDGDGFLQHSWAFGRLRAYGYLIVAEKLTL